MTIIAYRKGVMASDGQVTEGNSIFTTKKQKIHRLKNGGLLGSAGDADDNDLVDLVNRNIGKALTHKKLQSLEFEFAAILVDPDGSVHVIETLLNEDSQKWRSAMYQIKEQFVAVGSGAAWAMGAMDRGATAEQAVKTAIKFDTNCGGAVQVYKLEEDIE